MWSTSQKFEVTSQAAHPRASGGALGTVGPISATIRDSVFRTNEAPKGAGMSISAAKSVRISNTTIDTLQDQGSGAVWLVAAAIDDCSENPCELGNRCTFRDHSTFCEACSSSEIGTDGVGCSSCPADQVADLSRRECICPRDTYDATEFGGNTIQCVGDYHLGALTAIPAASKCESCAGLPCVDCTDGVKLSPGWSHGAGASTPSLVFHCPTESACPNSAEFQHCRPGHTGYLCNVCEDDFSMMKGLCERCSIVNSSAWTLLVLLGLATLLAGLIYAWRRRVTSDQGTSSLQLQLTDNPLQDATAGSSGLQTTLQRSDEAFLLVRVLYQPVRILIGYGQVVNQLGVVLEIEFPPLIRATFDVLSFLAVNIKSILQIQCLGDLTFCTSAASDWLLSLLTALFCCR